MKNQSVLFLKPGVAALQETELPPMGETSVLVRTLYSAVSAGTERANLMGEKNISGTDEHLPVRFPRQLGYSSVGMVEAVGSAVTGVAPGDRVICHFGKHNRYNVMEEDSVFRLTDSGLSSEEAALMVIACFPLLGLRRTRLEIGESVLILGMGILGLIGVQLLRAAGAVPVIAADLSPERRAMALQLGADLALDPREETFLELVREKTHGGANVVIEVTGAVSALETALRAAAPFGRISLLGCTRQPVPEVDLYHRVHAVGVELIGANHFARAQRESRPGCWTWRDDCAALVRLAEGGRLRLKPLIGEIVSPADAPQVYARLAEHPESFPIGVLFDWTKLGGERS